MQSVPAPSSIDLAAALHALRPKLHRFCARMTGSVIDGEDAVQETLLKALRSPPDVENLEAWVFRIARNAATDLLRRRTRNERRMTENTDPAPTPDLEMERKQALAANVRRFLQLPAGQRCAVILMDVLGYSLRDIEAITGSSVPAIKAALHRGRTRLSQLAREPGALPALAMAPDERSLFERYVQHFNARNFDAVRDLLADEVRLELVTRARMHGKAEVSTYFGNYAATSDWHFTLGSVDGQPALLARDPRAATLEPTYFVLLRFEGERLVHIRDFRYARYALEGAAIGTAPYPSGASGSEPT